MAFSEICRICLSVNVRMCVLKKTGLQYLYKALTNRFVHMEMDEDEEPIIVCFLCHARLIRCRRLQQQAIESNAVLEQLLAGGSMSIPKAHQARDEIQFTPINHIDIWPVECIIENDCKDDIFSLESVKVEEEKIENENFKSDENWSYEIEQPCIPTNIFSKPCEKNIKSNSTGCNINDVRKGDLGFESPTIKSKLKLKRDTQPVIKKGKDPAKIIKKKIFKQSVNILKENTSEALTKCIFECDDCRKTFLTKDILVDHISYSHKTQKNSGAVKAQVEQTPVSQLIDIYNCDICEFKTSQKRYIVAHLKAHVAKQVYCCNNCDYKCIFKSKLQRHMKIHTGEKPFSCNICEYKSITKSHLLTHIKIHTGEKLFSCNVCEFRCNSKSNLRTHMKIHTGEKPFSCNICEYKSTRKTDLKRHIRMHTGEKPFSCDICEFRCNEKGYLRTHTKKIHTGGKPFSCNIGERKYTRKTGLIGHIKVHTGEKTFSCNICEYKCTRKNDLKKHIKIHTGEKPFSCNICEYRCIRKGYLQTHMKIHTGEKPFSCNICEYRCISKSNLQRHSNIHTGAKSSS